MVQRKIYGFASFQIISSKQDEVMPEATQSASSVQNSENTTEQAAGSATSEQVTDSAITKKAEEYDNSHTLHKPTDESGASVICQSKLDDLLACGKHFHHVPAHVKAPFKTAPEKKPLTRGKRDSVNASSRGSRSAGRTSGHNSWTRTTRTSSADSARSAGTSRSVTTARSNSGVSRKSTSAATGRPGSASSAKPAGQSGDTRTTFSAMKSSAAGVPTPVPEVAKIAHQCVCFLFIFVCHVFRKTLAVKLA